MDKHSTCMSDSAEILWRQIDGSGGAECQFQTFCDHLCREFQSTTFWHTVGPQSIFAERLPSVVRDLRGVASHADGIFKTVLRTTLCFSAHPTLIHKKRWKLLVQQLDVRYHEVYGASASGKDLLIHVYRWLLDTATYTPPGGHSNVATATTATTTALTSSLNATNALVSVIDCALAAFQEATELFVRARWTDHIESKCQLESMASVAVCVLRTPNWLNLVQAHPECAKHFFRPFAHWLAWCCTLSFHIQDDARHGHQLQHWVRHVDVPQLLEWIAPFATQAQDSEGHIMFWCGRLCDDLQQQFVQGMLWYRQSADQGLAAAQFCVGYCYANGKGVEQDDGLAVRWYRQAAVQGHPGAQTNLGVCYDKGMGVLRDSVRAVKWFRRAAAQGDAAAQYNVGVCYKYGRGVQQDSKQAVEWFQHAADWGLAEAQTMLGHYFKRGECVAQDNEQAFQWYHRAALQGHAVAQYHCGLCHENGLHAAPQDINKATQWYRRAADQGVAEAQYALGLCYKSGKGVPQSASDAAEWFRQAAHQGHSVAQHHLGVCYRSGQGVPQDCEEASRWFQRAADQGHVPS